MSMKAKKPLEVVGWLGSSGYQPVIHEAARAAAQAAKKQTAQRQTVAKATKKEKS